MFFNFRNFFNTLFKRDFFIKEYDSLHRKNSDYEELLRENPFAFIRHKFPNIFLSDDQKFIIDSFMKNDAVCVKHIRNCGMTTVYMLLCAWLTTMYQNYTIIYVSPNQKRGQDFLKLVFNKLSEFMDTDKIRISDRYLRITFPNKTESFIYITSSSVDYNKHDRGNSFINTVFFDNSTNIFDLDYIFPTLTSHLDIPKEYSLDYNSFPPEGFICSSEETPHLASPATIFFEKIFNDSSYFPIEIKAPYRGQIGIQY